jgi:hypothetical protein
MPYQTLVEYLSWRIIIRAMVYSLRLHQLIFVALCFLRYFPAILFEFKTLTAVWRSLYGYDTKIPLN